VAILIDAQDEEKMRGGADDATDSNDLIAVHIALPDGGPSPINAMRAKPQPPAKPSAGADSKSGGGVGGGGVVSGQSKQAEAGEFVRKTIKYWVHSSNIAEVKAAIAKVLPQYVFSKDVSSYVQSVYFDNQRFDRYNDRLMMAENGKLYVCTHVDCCSHLSLAPYSLLRLCVSLSSLAVPLVR
jgi:hypothetical protein